MNPDTRLVVVDSLSDLCPTDKQFRETVRGLHEMAERCNVAVVATARPKNDRRVRKGFGPRGSWVWSLKPAGSDTAAGNGHENGHTNGHANGAGENGHAGDLERNGSNGEHESSQEDELEGFDFDHMPRELVLESLNYLRALESAAKDGTRSNGKPGKNGKASKNGKRKPR